MVRYCFLNMSEHERPNSGSAMDKIIGNVTAEMQNLDGQYASLGYSTPPPATENVDWSHHNSFNTHFNVHFSDSQRYNFNQSTFGFVQPAAAPQTVYQYDKQNNAHYEMLRNIQRSPPDVGMFDDKYNLLITETNQPQRINVNNSAPYIPNHTKLIENLVGNWVIPNTNGTYSPFGNPNQNLDQNQRDNAIKIPQNIEESFPITNQSDEKFQFNRDTKKPRIIAEVKPMRPTYSDVLTKSAPQTSTKPAKNENKETKLKKDVSKRNKSEKSGKNIPLNRSNTNNELNLKDASLDKNQTSKAYDKKTAKTGQLDRKWASLDNIAEPSTKNSKSKKKEEENDNISKNNVKKPKLNNSNTENEPNEIKGETYTISKNNLKKGNKFNRTKADASGTNDRVSGKRNQRTKRKENSIIIGFLKQKLKIYLKGWWKILYMLIAWLYQVILDIFSLSLHISHDFAVLCWNWLTVKWISLTSITMLLLRKARIFTWIADKFKKNPGNQEEPTTLPFPRAGLKHNLTMPTTGEEAMKRLLACRGKDPYSILGVSPSCTDDDIKRYYKRQAVLVHPDKNQQPGAEEAFKILVHAFDMIGVPERRASYDRGVAESAQVEQAWSELTELLAQLQKKVEAAANTIRCSACGLRHKRLKVDRPIYAARNCASCKIHHAAREGDIWAEAQCFGFLWHYYACMEGAVYDITDWAGCQKDSLKHIKSDSHHVQYRIALGKGNNQSGRRSSGTQRTDRPDLENLLNSLYGQSDNLNMPKKRNKKTK